MSNKLTTAAALALGLNAVPLGAATVDHPTLKASPYIATFEGTSVIVGPSKIATGPAFDSGIQHLKMAPHVKIEADGTATASCVLAGNPDQSGFVDVSGLGIEPNRYQKPYLRASVKGSRDSIFFNAGFPVVDGSLVVDGTPISSRVGGIMPDGQGISGYMIQPTSVNGIIMQMQSAFQNDGSIEMTATSPNGNTLQATYGVGDLSKSFEACHKFLSSPAEIEKLVNEASNILHVDTKPVTLADLNASKYDDLVKQREFKRSLLGKSCAAAAFSDAEMDGVKVVEVILQTGSEVTSLYGVNYMDGDKEITAVGDYYKMTKYPDGRVDVSGSISTFDPTKESCVGSAVATNGDAAGVYNIPAHGMGVPYVRNSGLNNNPIFGGSGNPIFGGFGGGGNTQTNTTTNTTQVFEYIFDSGTIIDVFGGCVLGCKPTDNPDGKTPGGPSAVPVSGGLANLLAALGLAGGVAAAAYHRKEGKEGKKGPAGPALQS